MPRIAPPPNTEQRSILRKVMDHRPQIRAAWAGFDLSVRFGTRLDAALKEAVRRALAHRGSCVYCASLGPPMDERSDRRTALAVALATTIIEDPNSLDDDMWSVVSDAFSEPELIELCAWICLAVLPSQMFGGFTGLEPASPEEIDSYEGWWQGDGLSALGAGASARLVAS